MEENDAKVQAAYPFKDRKFQRLLPIFLFRSKEGYDEFCLAHAKNFAGISGGFAHDDFYATSCESPNDPTHLHEATHQIMFNRIGLRGGGSWFQEGLAEFLRDSPQTKEHFRDVLDEIGSIPRSSVKNGNPIPIEKALKSTLDWSIDDLEREFTQYCVER